VPYFHVVFTLPAAVAEMPSSPVAAATRTRTQRPGKRLAVHAAELALEPNLQILSVGRERTIRLSGAGLTSNESVAQMSR
jgi:hypothetical protein